MTYLITSVLNLFQNENREDEDSDYGDLNFEDDENDDEDPDLRR